jgi:Tetracyclin repressor-like, C-terminal domain
MRSGLRATVAAVNHGAIIGSTTEGMPWSRAAAPMARMAARAPSVKVAAVSMSVSRRPTALRPAPPPLEQQIRAWADSLRHRDLPAAALHQGLIWWSQLHGLVSLELGHHIRATGVDPGLLFQTEIHELARRLVG